MSWTASLWGWDEGFAVNKLRATRDNMKGNSETQGRINGNSKSNGNEVQVSEVLTHFAVSK